MISVLVVVLAGGAYLAGWYQVSFWIVVLALLNGLFGLTRAIVNPGWYEAKAAEAGVAPNYGMLWTTKVVAIAVLAVVGWYVGRAAGYF